MSIRECRRTQSGIFEGHKNHLHGVQCSERRWNQMNSTAIGARIGKLVIVGNSSMRGVRVCRCDCGRRCTASASALRTGAEVK